MQVETCFCPKTLDGAAELLSCSDGKVRICAGGTDLFVMMRKGKADAKYLMDLSDLSLDYIRKNPDGTISVGAMATLTQVAESELLAAPAYNALTCAAAHVGSVQIRNAATLVGNICTGITSADTCVALLVLDTRVVAYSVRGSRTIPIKDFFVSNRKLALEPDELVTEIILPVCDDGCVSRFRKVGTRKELLISVLNIAALTERAADGSFPLVRLAMGVVAPIPIRLPKTEACLTGKTLTDSEIETAVETMKTEISPRSSNHGSAEYRTLAAANLLRSFLRQARGDGEENNDN